VVNTVLWQTAPPLISSFFKLYKPDWPR